MGDIRNLRNVAATLAAGLAGALVFVRLGLPSPWLSGAMVGVVGLLLLGGRAAMPNPLRDAGMLLTGVSTGSAITPEMFTALLRYPVSLTILSATTFLIVYTGRETLVRLFRWSIADATFASLPGALSAVIAAAGSAGLDLPRIVAVQAFRMFVLVAMLPSLVMVTQGAIAIPSATLMSAAGFAIVLLLALGLALIFERKRILAPFLLGAMAAAAVTHGSGLILGAPPQGIANMAMYLIGVFAGARFNEVNLRVLASHVPAMVVLFLVTVAVAGLGGFATAALTGTPLAEAMVAFAPGGLEAMIIMGLSLGLDPLYLSSHHILRFVLIAMALPLIVRAARGAD